eukprot:TRINITY_DN91273_c0_g1_i1.p1 TRINITY_DN91273_c0_g1~~TRINITY_DN91273_c0_g1_i1.p1  ORF type:complete len:326 (-),score=60.94 TRINITY_DN91273_c0_g1_i1:105-1082(-)
MDGEFVALLRGGTIGALALCALSTPLDVARHAAQAAITKKRPCPGLTEALRTAVAPGASGLWRGFAPALCSSALAPAAFLLAYEVQRGSTEVIQAGMYARAVQVAVTQPFDFFRTIRQSIVLLPDKEKPNLLRSPWEVATADGPRSMWRGFIPTLLRDVSASGLFWFGYLSLSQSLLPRQDYWEAFDAAAARQRALSCAGISALCAGAAAVATQPFDVVKTKMQIHERNTTNKEGYRRVKVARFFATFRQLFADTGFRGLWVGGVARAVCAAGSGLILGPVFEYGQLLADDSTRPLRNPLVLGEDPSRVIVHPRSTKDMFIDVKL